MNVVTWQSVTAANQLDEATKINVYSSSLVYNFSVSVSHFEQTEEKKEEKEGTKKRIKGKNHRPPPNILLMVDHKPPQ
jgi:hypothetical protein